MPETVWWDYIDEVITIDDKTGYAATLELRQDRRHLRRHLGRRRGRRCPAGRARLPDDASSSRCSPTPGSATSRSSIRTWLAGQGLIDSTDA